MYEYIKDSRRVPPPWPHEWDTAAAHAVVTGAGKSVKDYENGNSLSYNKEELLNPWFVVG